MLGLGEHMQSSITLHLAAFCNIFIGFTLGISQWYKSVFTKILQCEIIPRNLHTVLDLWLGIYDLYQNCPGLCRCFVGNLTIVLMFVTPAWRIGKIRQMNLPNGIVCLNRKLCLSKPCANIIGYIMHVSPLLLVSCNISVGPRRKLRTQHWNGYT